MSRDASLEDTVMFEQRARKFNRDHIPILRGLGGLRGCFR
jgi:hypothetical protein